jgi:hypothetical protein
MIGNIIIFESQNDKPGPLKGLGSYAVILLRVCAFVLAPIQFYDQLSRRAIEVRDVMIYHFLALESDGIPIQKAVPKMLLLRRHIIAHLPGARD